MCLRERKGERESFRARESVSAPVRTRHWARCRHTTRTAAPRRRRVDLPTPETGHLLPHEFYHLYARGISDASYGITYVIIYACIFINVFMRATATYANPRS